MNQVGRRNEANRVDWVAKTLGHLPAGIRLLDAGAGEQPYRKFCERLEYVAQDSAAYDAAATDTGLQMEGWEYGRLHHRCDITDIPEPDASFDAILCTEVFEHLPDPLAAMREFARLLRAGGELIITAPFSSLTHFAPQHFATGFNRYFYETHLARFGFEVIEVTPNGNYFEWVAQELRRIRPTARRYAQRRSSWLEQVATRYLLRRLRKYSAAGGGSAELACFGLHVRAETSHAANRSRLIECPRLLFPPAPSRDTAMLILYAAMRYDYGHPEQGDSFEHCNFYDSLRRQGHELIYFDYATELAARGRDAMNRRLLEVATAEKPAVMFTVLFGDELDPHVVRRISDLPDTTTVNWFCDDHWRFDDFSRKWAHSFNWVVTTDFSAVARYRAIGYENVIMSQWACNHHLYQKLDLPPKYDVSFVGRPHGNRREVLAALRAQGIRVNVWGTGWGRGRVTTAQMIEVFNQSRINLNLSNASCSHHRSRWRRRGDWARRLGHRLVGKRPDVIAEGRRLDLAADHLRHQIKGRNFEVPGCGGFLLTEDADNLRKYYTPGDEIGTFNSFETLVNRIDHYLEHDDERAAAADWGYRRTLRDHTYAQRFQEIFQRMGCTPELRNAA